MGEGARSCHASSACPTSIDAINATAQLTQASQASSCCSYFTFRPTTACIRAVNADLYTADFKLGSTTTSYRTPAAHGLSATADPKNA